MKVLLLALLCSFQYGVRSLASEVVGASGRIGSQFLPYSQAVPRGVCPGCISPNSNEPIYVAVPSKYWPEIYQQTLPKRRCDLVFIGNGLIPPWNCTFVVPHYGILVPGDKPITSIESPPTFVSGKHAWRVQTILQTQGIRVEVVKSAHLIAAKKLLWATCMWLLCHDNNECNVSEIPLDKLYDLVNDLWPAFVQEVVVGRQPPRNLQPGDHLRLHETVEYLQAYSRSIPNAVPSKELALRELEERHSVWLKHRSQEHPQRFHQELLRRVGGDHVLQRALNGTRVDMGDTKNREIILELPEIGLSVYGKSRREQYPCRSAIVIGSGILGSCVARNLVRRGLKVTIVAPTEDSTTTLASWAWLNANQKEPDHYKWLNQLGMLSWRRDPVLQKLPVWCGSLVQFRQKVDHREFAGYAAEGPLSHDRVLELEPFANFSHDGPIYWFAEEGLVDPKAACRAMRYSKGIQFVNGIVSDTLRDESGRVVGLRYQETSCSGECLPTTKTIQSDVVVVAAGIGAALPIFGGVPLLDRPGSISFASPPPESPRRLSRILVDTVRESHVLQRPDGSIVAGGGFLEVGGSSSVMKPLSAETASQLPTSLQHQDSNDLLLQTASHLAPQIVQPGDYLRSCTAVRPMPKDGLPVLGWVAPGLYTIVSHSAVTLAPLLTSLAAAEIAESVDLNLLKPYRPSRFTTTLYSTGS